MFGDTDISEFTRLIRIKRKIYEFNKYNSNNNSSRLESSIPFQQQAQLQDHNSEESLTELSSYNSDYEDMEIDSVTNSPSTRSSRRRGHLVTFFRNGDANFKGLTTAISEKNFSSFETLLVWLNGKIQTTAGVRYVFRLPDAKLITDVKQFQIGGAYVVSSVRTFYHVDYGYSRESYWINRRPSPKDPPINSETASGPFKYSSSTSSPKSISTTSRSSSLRNNNFHENAIKTSTPRQFYIISNTKRTSKQKVLLNPKTNQSFEDMLYDIGKMIILSRPPATALFTALPPYSKVESYSQLLREFKNHDAFIACGMERFPLEVLDGYYPSPSDEQQLPPHTSSRNSYLKQYQDQIKNNSPRSKQLPLKKQYHPNHDNDDSINDNHHYDGNGYNQPPPPPPVVNSPRSMNKINAKPPPQILTAFIRGETMQFYCPNDMKCDATKPNKRLKLDWIYGINVTNKSPLHVLSTGELVYYVSCIAVVYDRKKNSQRFYTAHDSTITCITLHPDPLQPYIATAQSVRPCIRIWDGRSMATYSTVGEGVIQGTITTCQLSSNGTKWCEGGLLLVIDSLDKHTLSVWDWRSDRMLVKTTASTESVAVSAIFHNEDPSIIITYGRQHVHFWKLFADEKKETSFSLLRDKHSGNFDNRFAPVPAYVSAVVFSKNGDLITADSEGRLIIWSQKKANQNGNDDDNYVINERLTKSLKRAHSKSISSLYMLADGTLLSSSNNEIKAWDSSADYRLVKERQIPESAGYIRSIFPRSPNAFDGQIYILTNRSSLLEGSLQDKLNFVFHSHYEPVNSIVAHSLESDYFYTACADFHVCKWSAKKHLPIWRIRVELACSSLATDKIGRVVAVGTTSGRLIILNGSTGQHLSSIQVSYDYLESISYSPHDNRLAIACSDGIIYVLDVLDDAVVYRRRKNNGKLIGHNNSVLNVDWSTDGRFLQSISRDYDLLFWDTDDMRQTDAVNMANTDWSTHNCPLGARLVGVWKGDNGKSHKDDDDNNDGAGDIYCSKICNDRKLLLVGGKTGFIRLYKYPCTLKTAKFDEKLPYNETVRCVEFSKDNKYLFSVGGGKENGVLQWTLTDKLDYM